MDQAKNQNRKKAQFLNDSMTHLDAVREYIRNWIIFYNYLNESHISEKEAQSRPGGYFPQRPKSNTQIQSTTPKNGPLISIATQWLDLIGYI